MNKQPKFMRLFIAIDLNKAILQAIEALLPDLKKQHHAQQLRWSPIENLHITLVFLGEVAEEKLPEIVTSINACLKNQASFTIPINKLMRFPPHRHRILAISASLTNELAKLFYQLSQAVKTLGYQTDKHIFLPHITLARTKDKKAISESPIMNKINLTLDVDHITLFESIISNNSSHYRPIHKFEFANKSG